jgi:hypothetical protein
MGLGGGPTRAVEEYLLGLDKTAPPPKEISLSDPASRLTAAVGITKANTRIYRASIKDCRSCALKKRCCPGQPHRKVMRSVHETARNAVRRLEGTPGYLQSRRDRRKVEMLFAHLKRILTLDRLRLRGPTGARDGSNLAAAAQNLRKMAKLLVPAQATLA